MVVEHTFVTTQDDRTSLEKAQSFLQEIGYRLAETTNPLERLYTRGGSRVNSTIHFAKLPQRVHVHFDRGRVNVAASNQEHRKVHQLQRELMLSVVNGLEAVMVRNESVVVGRREFDLASHRIDVLFRKRRIRRWLLYGFLLFLLAILAGLIIYAVRAS